MADADHAADSTPPVSTSPPEAADAEDADADDYRNVWLKIWNNSSNPSKASCRIAFDILYYCYSPANQLRTLYRTGEPDLCHKAMEDVKLCARIRAGKLTTQEARAALRASRDSFIVREPHVWEWRTEPPEQFRRDNTAAAEASASAASDESSGAAHTSTQQYPSMR